MTKPNYARKDLHLLLLSWVLSYAFGWFCAWALRHDWDTFDRSAEMYQTALFAWVLNHQLAVAVGCLIVGISGCYWLAKRGF